jgi:hypothetical protein
LTQRKRTTPEQARQILAAAGADFDALASIDYQLWQPAAAKLLDAGCRVADIAKFTRVKRQRVYKWAEGRGVK